MQKTQKESKEIKRNTWARFCRKFSADNMLREANISFTDKARNNVEFSGEYPLMGLTLEKKGRLIDGFMLHAGWTHPDRVAQPLLSIKDPEQVLVEKDKDGTDARLQVKTKNGGVATIELNDGKEGDRIGEFVRKIAYSMYEQRGYTHGNDRDDWLEAERKLKEAEQRFA